MCKETKKSIHKIHEKHKLIHKIVITRTHQIKNEI